jgi:hypothetical protein
MTLSTSLYQVRKALKQAHPALSIRKIGSGYYFYSDNDASLNDAICWYSGETLIAGTGHWSQLSIEQWIETGRQFISKVFEENADK